MTYMALRMTVILACIAGIVVVSFPERSARAQASKKTKKKAINNVQSLDVRAEQLQNSFTKDAEELAGQYADAGHLEKAKAILKAAVTLNPDSAQLQKKLKQLDESLLTANTFEVSIDASHSWKPAGAMVFADKPIRFTVDGNYRFVISTSVTGAGFPEKNTDTDMVPGFPCGALLGIILVNDKPGKPFLIGEGRDFTPKEQGILFLRVNAPSDCRNTGKLKVSVSGMVKAL